MNWLVHDKYNLAGPSYGLTCDAEIVKKLEIEVDKFYIEIDRNWAEEGLNSLSSSENRSKEEEIEVSFKSF